MESKRPGAALISYALRSINQINAVWPRGVLALGGIPKFVEHRWNLNAQFAHASSRHESPFLFTARTGKYHVVFYVARHLPDIAGVCLGDVNHQKCDPVLELLVELVEGRNLPPKGRSGVTSKHQHHWTIRRSQRGQLYLCRFVELCQCEVRCWTTHVQAA